MNKADYGPLKERGLCVRCGKHRARAGRVLCRNCADEVSAYGKAHRAQNNVSVAAKRARNKAAGLCIHCGKPAAEGHVSCEDCLFMKRVSRRVKRLRGERWQGLFSPDVMQKLAQVIAVKYASQWLEEE